MPPSPDREFVFPQRRRVPWWAWALAAAIHVPLVVLLVTTRRRAQPLLTPAGLAVMHDTGTRMTLPGIRRWPPALAQRPVTPRASARIPPPAEVASVTAPAVTPPAIDSPPPAAVPDLGPHYGTGRLWVRPLPESPRNIAKALTGKSNAQLTDSIVTAMVQHYIDEMATENREHPSALPSWTTKIGGKTVGLDQRWIYLGPLKIPTALLALLPIKVSANPTEWEYNRKLQSMRDDLMEAARRSATYDDFKEAVKELHEQTERDRQFKQNQRTPPSDSSHPE